MDKRNTIATKGGLGSIRESAVSFSYVVITTIYIFITNITALIVNLANSLITVIVRITY